MTTVCTVPVVCGLFTAMLRLGAGLSGRHAGKGWQVWHMTGAGGAGG